MNTGSSTYIIWTQYLLRSVCRPIKYSHTMASKAANGTFGSVGR